MDLSSLNVLIGANTAGLQAGLRQATAIIQRFSEQGGQALQDFARRAGAAGTQASQRLVQGFSSTNTKLAAAFAEMEARQQRFEAGFGKLGGVFQTVGENFAKYVSLPIIAGLALSANSAIDFESAFAGVVKTLNVSGLSAQQAEAEYAKMSTGIRGLAKDIPATASDLAKIAENAGQLGIQRDNVLGFTRTIADLGVATNLAGEEAASTLAKFANITSLDQSKFSNLGSTIVALGNNFATTERDIAEMGLRIAGAGKQVGLTDAQILAFSASLSSVGINAEAGGTAFSTVLKKMQLAVVEGGDTLEQFAKVAGVSGKQFAQTFKTDAAGAINAFVQGLGRMDKSSGEALLTLGQLDLADIRVSDSLLRLSAAQDLSARATNLASDAFAKNTALTKEAETRYATTASQIQLAKNRLNDLGITVGNLLLPVIRAMASGVGEASDALAAMNPTAARVVLVVGGLAAAIGPLALAIGGVISLLPTLAAGFTALGTAVTFATGPIGLAIAATATLAGGIYYLSQANERAKESYTSLSQANQRLTSTVEPLLTRYEELTRKTTLSKQEQEELATIIKKVEAAVPGSVSKIDEYGNTLAISTQKTRAFIEAQRELEKAEAADALEGAKQDLAEYGQELSTLKAKMEEFNRTGMISKQIGSTGVSQQVALTSSEFTKLRKELAAANVQYQQQEAYVQKLNQTLGIVPRTLQNIIAEQNALEQALTSPFLKAQNAIQGLGKKTPALVVDVKPQVSPQTLAILKEQLKGAQDKLQNTQTDTKAFSSAQAEVKRLEDLIKKYEDTGKAAKTSGDQQAEALKSLQNALRAAEAENQAYGGSYDLIGKKIQVLESGITSLITAGFAPTSSAVTKSVSELRRLETAYDNLKTSIERAQRQDAALGQRIEKPQGPPSQVDYVQADPNGSGSRKSSKDAFQGQVAGIQASARAQAAAYQQLTEVQLQATQRQATFNTQMEELFTDLGANIGPLLAQIGGILSDGIAGMISGTVGVGDGLKGIFFGILGVVGDFMTQFGQQLVAIGVGALGLKSAFANPVTAIAAGAALIALGGIAKGVASRGAARLQALPGGGGGFGASSYQSPNPSAAATRPQDRLQIEIKMLPVDIRASGKDLRGVLSLDSYHLKRYN